MKADDSPFHYIQPLMKRVQEALFKQLSEQDTKLAMEIKEKVCFGFLCI
jgi:hypothetical protein